MPVSIPSLPNTSSLKTLEDFTETVGVLFEPAPPLAKGLFDAHTETPFKDYRSIISEAKKLIQNMNQQDKLQVIDAHPRIGQKNTKKLSNFSKIEQGVKEETKTISPEEEKVLEEFTKLNADYEQKFGFKFIIFVNGRPKKDLLPVGRRRMQNSKDSELETGIQAMLDIALDRLSKIEKAGKLATDTDTGGASTATATTCKLCVIS
mmetsp:Transcript_22707/g.40164  ORF Transcript_22707/g.40164 Transcript_22707/m.40164 type:complete len:206 (-) Transcript_22707:115-732(-)